MQFSLQQTFSFNGNDMTDSPKSGQIQLKLLNENEAKLAITIRAKTANKLLHKTNSIQFHCNSIQFNTIQLYVVHGKVAMYQACFVVLLANKQRCDSIQSSLYLLFVLYAYDWLVRLHLTSKQTSKLTDRFKCPPTICAPQKGKVTWQLALGQQNIYIYINFRASGYLYIIIMVRILVYLDSNRNLCNCIISKLPAIICNWPSIALFCWLQKSGLAFCCKQNCSLLLPVCWFEIWFSHWSNLEELGALLLAFRFRFGSRDLDRT